MTRFVLASASPARRKLLQAAGIEPDVLVSGVDETAVEADSAEELSLTLARLKAEAVAHRFPPGTLVLGCDSVLAFEGEIFGKPADADEAVKRWSRMRGQRGVLHTGHYLIKTGAGATGRTAETTVHFADVSDEEIAAYVATGEPLNVAGAFTIDGIGGVFVERIEGDHGTVIGLSLPLLRKLLAELGHPITEFWSAS
ncbi:Maf family protein [Phytohabitans rumicis]|uniref:Nucleoside triphosphate pyrophosphatase n=1 Tax=Phytohabitans rumicis TaxID=1076125 RepID=A0A6V8LB65_9ACTN|nr:Maf family protein [Phytohabitans rumicis]GFJ91307.1 Maf-like protein [Phytohabitans rumicis]